MRQRPVPGPRRGGGGRSPLPGDGPGTTGGGRVPVLRSATKALRVLEAVAESPSGVSAKEVAERLGLALPSTYHLLSTLVDAGYVVHLSGQARYGLGSKAYFLGQALTRQLAVPRAVAVEVRRLHREGDAAAYYAVYREREVVVAHVADSERRPRAHPWDVGFAEAAHATAFGKVMLAAMPVGDRTAYLAQTGLPALTPHTITGTGTLEEHLAHVRESGIALELEEFRPGLGCLAAPVRTATGTVAGAVAVSLPVPELRQRRWTLERVVRQGATRVTRALARAGSPA